MQAYIVIPEETCFHSYLQFDVVLYEYIQMPKEYQTFKENQ